MRKLQKTLAILVASSNFLITGICHSEPPFVQSDDKGEYRYDQNKKREHLEFYKQGTNENTGSQYRIEKLNNHYFDNSIFGRNIKRMIEKEMKKEKVLNKSLIK